MRILASLQKIFFASLKPLMFAVQPCRVVADYKSLQHKFRFPEIRLCGITDIFSRMYKNRFPWKLGLFLENFQLTRALPRSSRVHGSSDYRVVCRTIAEIDAVDNAINETKIPPSWATVWHCRGLFDSTVAKFRGQQLNVGGGIHDVTASSTDLTYSDQTDKIVNPFVTQVSLPATWQLYHWLVLVDVYILAERTLCFDEFTFAKKQITVNAHTSCLALSATPQLEDVKSGPR